MYCLFVVILTKVSDIGSLQKEVGALEEMKSQLFLEYVDLHAVKVPLLYLLTDIKTFLFTGENDPCKDTQRKIF